MVGVAGRGEVAGYPEAVQLTLVDAFTDRPFAGNQAAVAVLDHWPDDAAMQRVAAELGWSETAFAVPRADGDWDLRWFTPAVEVDLCGHATLAAAHVLGGTARFHTRSGMLDCAPGEPPEGWAGEWLAMAFPADPPTEAPAPEGLALPGLEWFGRGRTDSLAVLADPAEVRRLTPDLAAVAALGTRCLIVTAPGDRSGIDCVSRVFAPNAGIAEDPVTGSAHCTLAEWWGPRLGRDTLMGEQASARGGFVAMRRAGDRVVLGGQAVIVGRILLLGLGAPAVTPAADAR